MKRWITILSMSVMVFATHAALACPMCKDSIGSSENGAPGHASGLPAGFNNSIYLMLAGFLVTIGFVATGLIRTIRSTDAQITHSQNSPESQDQSSGSSPDGTE